jgi:pimeloyl-ACP methyl ester carboxylesterase
MKTVKIVGVLLCMCLMLSVLIRVEAQNNPQIQGIWVGDMRVSEKLSLKMAFEVKLTSDNSLAATMNSIDQGAFDIPVDSVLIENDQLSFCISSLNCTYRGRIVEGNLIEGNLTQKGAKPCELNMTKVDAMPGRKPKRPQEPRKPYPYQEENITYANAEADVTIAGTLTKPKTGGPFPAVLLVTGSGPNDRDQHIFGHKVFLVLADYLTREGFAVLRVDDRGVGQSTGNFSTASVIDLASDVIAGIKYLKGRKDVIHNQVGLIGHSLGGEIAPLAAAQMQEVDFLVLMAASGISLEEGMYEQCEAIYSGMGISSQGIELNRRILKSCLDVVRIEKDNGRAKTRIAETLSRFNREVSQLSKVERKKLELSLPLDPKEYYAFLSSAMRVDLFHNPQTALEKLKCPVLAINGSTDLQVLPKNLEIIEEALRRGGNTDCTIKLFPEKNHLFQNSKTGALSEYYEIEETMAPEVQVYLSNWLKGILSKEK